jgi:hypothetical protein
MSDENFLTTSRGAFQLAGIIGRRPHPRNPTFEPEQFETRSAAFSELGVLLSGIDSDLSVESSDNLREVHFWLQKLKHLLLLWGNVSSDAGSFFDDLFPQMDDLSKLGLQALEKFTNIERSQTEHEETVVAVSPEPKAQIEKLQTARINIEEWPFKIFSFDTLNFSSDQPRDRKFMQSSIIQLNHLWDEAFGKSDKPFTRQSVVKFLSGNFGWSFLAIDEMPMWRVKWHIEKARGRQNLGRDELEPVNLDRIRTELGEFIDTVGSSDNEDTKRNYRRIMEHINRLSSLLPMRTDRSDCSAPNRELLRELEKSLLDVTLNYIIKNADRTVELPIIPPFIEQLNTQAVQFSVEGRTRDEPSMFPEGDGDDALSAKQQKLAPSRIKAKAAYEWAMSAIPGADDMTIAELFEAIDLHPSSASECIGPNPATFGKYLRDAGIKRYDTRGNRTGGSVRRHDEI